MSVFGSLCVESAINIVRGVRRFGPATSKTGNKHYNRGRGAWKGGFISSKGQFVRDDSRMKFMVVPDLTDFKLTPYVARDTPKVNLTFPRPGIALPVVRRKTLVEIEK